MARVEQRGLPAVKVHTNPSDCRYLSGKRAVNSVLVPWGDTRPRCKRPEGELRCKVWQRDQLRRCIPSESVLAGADRGCGGPIPSIIGSTGSMQPGQNHPKSLSV